jgi:hypothetical protein
VQAHQKSIDSMWHSNALGAWRSAYSFQMLTWDSMVTICMHAVCIRPVGSRAPPVQCERKLNHKLLSQSLTLCENERLITHGSHVCKLNAIVNSLLIG